MMVTWALMLGFTKPKPVNNDGVRLQPTKGFVGWSVFWDFFYKSPIPHSID